MVFWGGEIRLVLRPKRGTSHDETRHAQCPKAEKFAALCALVARDLGYGELQHLSEEDRNHIEGEAKHCVALWGETLEIKTSPTIRPITPLRRLLAEYHETCEKILDEQEIEVGLWAYKKRPQGPRRRSASF